MYTGHMLEWDCFGSCLWKWEAEPEYVPFRQAMARVRKSQPWDPTDPEPLVSSNLHAYVCLALGVEDWSEVALYTSIGSPLDRFHGVDAFFHFRGRVVTIDVTANPHKNSYKADVILSAEAIENGGLKQVASKIAALLQGSSRTCYRV